MALLLVKKQLMPCNQLRLIQTATSSDLATILLAINKEQRDLVFYNWQEGNWSIRVRASNIEGQDPVPLAKEIVAYLEKASLPAPESTEKLRLK